MRAEIVAIGDELTSGVRLDTNSQWLSEQLAHVGVPVAFHTTVGDDLEDIMLALRCALQRAELIVVSGGLGPTADDLTRQALALVVDQPLVTDQAVLQHIRSLFARRGREMPARNAVQAEFPAGSHVLANPHGTAPGIRYDLHRAGEASRLLFALPGVPAELQQMWTESVVPQLLAERRDGQRLICHRTIRCFGAGESDIEQRLPDIVRRGRQPAVGITASQATISLRITAAGETADACQAAMQPTVELIHQCLGDLVYGEDDETLQEVVTRLLEQQQLTLATVEWGTQGLLGSWLATLGSRHYLGGLTIANAASLALLDTTLVSRQPNDEQLVAQLARRWREQAGSQVALAIGPQPTADPQPSRIHFALATAHEQLTSSSIFAAHPAIQQQKAAKEALNFVRLWLLGRARGGN